MGSLPYEIAAVLGHERSDQRLLGRVYSNAEPRKHNFALGKFRHCKRHRDGGDGLRCDFSDGGILSRDDAADRNGPAAESFGISEDVLWEVDVPRRSAGLDRIGLGNVLAAWTKQGALNHIRCDLSLRQSRGPVLPRIREHRLRTRPHHSRTSWNKSALALPAAPASYLPSAERAGARD
jgi:hypothetical protein